MQCHRPARRCARGSARLEHRPAPALPDDRYHRAEGVDACALRCPLPARPAAGAAHAGGSLRHPGARAARGRSVCGQVRGSVRGRAGPTCGASRRQPALVLDPALRPCRL
eukprot:101616-Prymnesium_polylepis.2